MNAAQLNRMFEGESPVIGIVLSGVRGSSPREPGAQMFVSPIEILGTIGGGQMEHQAIKAAHDLLVSGETSKTLDIPLGPEIGQCCGGHVSITLTRMSDPDKTDALQHLTAQNSVQPHIYIFGSGHVGRALADQLQHLPFKAILVDQRESELNRCGAAIEKCLTAIPESQISAAPQGSAFIILTHDHALDFLLAAAALDRRDAAYVGLIGSATKRARFEKWYREQNHNPHPGTLVCPIGASTIRDKRPEMISAFVVAEIASALWRSAETNDMQSIGRKALLPSDTTRTRHATGTPQ